jgi:hypothetical protein
VQTYRTKRKVAKPTADPKHKRGRKRRLTRATINTQTSWSAVKTSVEKSDKKNQKHHSMKNQIHHSMKLKLTGGCQNQRFSFSSLA